MMKNLQKEKKNEDVSEFYRFVIFWGGIRTESWRFGREIYRLVCVGSGVSVRRDLAMFHRVAKPHPGSAARLLHKSTHF
jgi:hypothetical protein